MNCLLAIMGVFLLLWIETRAAIKRETISTLEENHHIRKHFTDNLHHPHGE